MWFRIKSCDNLAIFGSVLGFLSLFFGWLTLKPNRLAAGTSLSLWDSFGWGGTALITIFWLVILVLSFFKDAKIRSLYSGIIGNLILVAIIALIGLNADRLLINQSSLVRVSLSSGIWLSWLAIFIILFTSRRGLNNEPLLQNIISFTGLVVAISWMGAGWLDNIALLQEYMAQKERLLQELQTHIWLFSGSVLVGMLIGVPLGIWASQSRRAARPIFILANIAETIPSLALFGILIAPLSALSQAFPVLGELGIHGIGTAPALIALIIYSLLPIIQNTYSGLHQLDPSVIDAGFGVGMSRSGVLISIRLPLAAPFIVEGIRTAAVQAVGNTAIAALIGAGGLGQLIFQGLGQADSDLILLGSIPVIILALVVDIIMKTMVKISTPSGVSARAP